MVARGAIDRARRDPAARCPQRPERGGRRAVALANGIEAPAVTAGLREFAGVAHRLEMVGELDGVIWVNDSKATNAAATAVALDAFAAPIHLILGGRSKGQDFSALRDAVAARARAVHVIGEATDQVLRELDGTVPLYAHEDLREAVAAARATARGGEVVLLSPGCASFDQFADFEDRGRVFRALVRAL